MKSHNIFLRISALKCHYLLLVVALLTSPMGYSQTGGCGTASPDAAGLEAAEAIALAAATAASTAAASITPPPVVEYKIPVRVTVCLTDEGDKGWSDEISNTYVDNFLALLNSKLSLPATPTIRINFFRCGPVNNIYESDFHDNILEINNYSYVPNFLNLYFYYKTSRRAHAFFPWVLPGPSAFMTAGSTDVGDGTLFHELGHTLGLLHTFEGGNNLPYRMPVTVNQQDNPVTGTTPREMIIGSNALGKFPFNAFNAGDKIIDTKPDCNPLNSSGNNFPSAATISDGCYDNDPNTPCINGCTDNDPSTPCEGACITSNCVYTGTYRDYNGDYLTDDGTVRNYMSQWMACYNQFTPGQVLYAASGFNIFLNNYYRPNLCGTLDDRVELEGSSVGLDRVFVTIIPTLTPYDISKTITSRTGDFSAKTGETNTEVTAALKKLGKGPGFTFQETEWLSGISTKDLALISKHVLGIEPPLDGYGVLAADVNGSKSVTTFDLVELRKLILGIYTKLPAHEQPFKFIPEYVTQTVFNTLNIEFDGNYFPGDPTSYDDPFDQINTGGGGPVIPAGAPYLDAGYKFTLVPRSLRNGFDAVKIGDVDSSYNPDFTGEATEECPGEIDLFVPNISILEGQKVNLNFKTYNFSNISALQLGLFLANNDFEYLGANSNNLEETWTESSMFGSARLPNDEFRISWLRQDLGNKTLENGAGLFTLQLKAKKPIPNLQNSLKLDDKILESFFLKSDLSCKSNTSLEVEVTFPEGTLERNSNTSPSSGMLGALKCYPNPITQELKIIFDAEAAFDGHLYFTDMWGRTAKEFPYHFEQGRNILHLQDLDDLAAGVWNVSLRSNDAFFSAKVVKQ